MQSSQQVEQTTKIAEATMRRYRAESKIRGPKVVMPGGRVMDATPYLQDMHRTQDQSKTFADIDEHPEKYLKDPKPGYRYAWVKKGDAEAAMKIRTGAYEEISSEDMLDEAELPFVEGDVIKRGKTHQGTRRCVEIYDVKLVGISPKAWHELYEVRQSMAVMKIASDTQSFFEQVEREGAEAGIEVTDDKGNDLTAAFGG